MFGSCWHPWVPHECRAFEKLYLSLSVATPSQSLESALNVIELGVDISHTQKVKNIYLHQRMNTIIVVLR